MATLLILPILRHHEQVFHVALCFFVVLAWTSSSLPSATMSSDQLSVPPPAVSTRRRLSDALLQMVPNFPVSYPSPVSKLARALTRHMEKSNTAQVCTAVLGLYYWDI